MAFGRGLMGQLLAGMSPRLGVSQVPRALPVGLHWLKDFRYLKPKRASVTKIYDVTALEYV